VKIKFNSIQDLGDARYAAAAMAEWMGFAIDGETSIPVQQVQEIIGWCSGPKIILEVHEPNIDKINAWMNIIPVDGIQCHEDLLALLKPHFPEIKDWLLMNQNGSLLFQDEILIPIEPNEESAHQLVNGNPIFGIHIHCQKETSVGKKDYGNWNDFFDIINE
jgi:hypothetical protein